ncbi:hypothetical protein [Bailinhaonella thermotolerans]|uniref:Uncharacterized protein n=1 Tax=Bailinhaonella thermotolerans TaxID=1070861 RepID=A0A3A4ATI6_9ACTN|nr:hypothetical protein [Bailinhaonella thermotolerans]RJL31615.1 hypothetical protein D5H75_18010 [Bailinhaonella thermotolerans]
MTITDLRYGAACLRRACRAGHRPRPSSLRHRAEVRTWARAHVRDRSVARRARVQERQERRRVRHALDQARRRINAARGSHLASGPLGDIDVPPTRHRHNAVWQY